MQKHERGLSLIELIVAVAVLSIAIFLGVSFFSFGTRSFARGDLQSQVQADVRAASFFITQELRNATALELIATFPSLSETSSGTGWHYIFVENNRIIHYFNGVSTPVTEAIIEPEPTGRFDLRIVNRASRNLLAFTIAGSRGGQRFVVETQVLLNNLPLSPAAANQAVRYRKP
ncbi:MAG: hypothetical protein DDT21_02721 [Syntrophomonadaceae bacterium]|nr:hypothetical protein [Bacillota bacterium]